MLAMCWSTPSFTLYHSVLPANFWLLVFWALTPCSFLEYPRGAVCCASSFQWCLCSSLDLVLNLRSVTSFQSLLCLDHLALSWTRPPLALAPSAALVLPAPRSRISLRKWWRTQRRFAGGGTGWQPSPSWENGFKSVRIAAHSLALQPSVLVVFPCPSPKLSCEKGMEFELLSVSLSD